VREYAYVSVFAEICHLSALKLVKNLLLPARYDSGVMPLYLL
jgi:hypothetical protein